MSNDQSDRMSKLQQAIVQFENESRQILGEERENLCVLKETLRLSLRVMGVAALPGGVWVGSWAAVITASEPVFAQVLLICFSLGIFALISIAASRASGLVAYYWFNRTVVHLRLATVVLSLLAAATVFVWVIVIARW